LRALRIETKPVGQLRDEGRPSGLAEGRTDAELANGREAEDHSAAGLRLEANPLRQPVGLAGSGAGNHEMGRVGWRSGLSPLIDSTDVRE
jgi:hypothetical protein